MTGYVCDKCGACCRNSILEVAAYDVLREPRIASMGKKLDGKGTLKLPILDISWGLNGERVEGRGYPCVFLGDDNLCGIYSSRPHCCLVFAAGGDQCQMFREAAKLAPLAEIEIEPTVENEIMAGFLEQADSDD